jgi:hypothetical protein
MKEGRKEGRTERKGRVEGRHVTEERKMKEGT